MSPAQRLDGRSTVHWLVLGVLGFAMAVLGALRYRSETRIGGYVSDLEGGTPPPGRPGSETFADLPAPVQRYFEYALEDGTPPVRGARLKQRGEFRLGGADSAWHPLTATQYVSTTSPGFVWDARLVLRRILRIRVVDRYQNGEGRLAAKLFSLVPVSRAGPDPEMNEAELVRYLAEAVWYPTALLPSHGVEWTAVDDHAAEATIEDGDVSASLVFRFDDRGRVERVETERYNRSADAYVLWTGHFEEYERRDGRWVPTRGEVEWNFPDGDVPYARVTVTDVEYVR